MFRSPHTPKRLLVIAVLAALGSFLAAGCGSDAADDSSPAPDYAAKLAGSPPPLAALHAQGDELLDGGLEAFEGRMSGLEGFPAVVNVWASWCGPCRAEFPHFQQAAAQLGKKVAFLGVDSDDDADAAATFLADHSVPYPSYSDPDKKIGNSLGATHGIPATTFFDRMGEQTFVKFGPYASLEELEADIDTYAVQGQSG